MIVKWKKERLKVIPYKVKNVLAGKIILLPGYNDVDEKEWVHARVGVKDLIGKDIIEVATEVKKTVKKVEDPVTKEVTEKTEVTIISKKFKALSLEKASEIVADTYNMETLKKWKKNESRDSIRKDISNQIDKIEKYGEEKAKKKKDE